MPHGPARPATRPDHRAAHRAARRAARPRRRLLGPGLAAAALLGVTLVPASPTWAEPSIEEVQARVDRLWHEAEQAQERLHDARLELEEIEDELAALEADERRQERALESVRDEVEDAVVRQYQGDDVATLGQVVVSEDPSAFLAQLSTVSTYHDLQAQVFDDYAVQLEALDVRREAVEERAAELAAVEERLQREAATVDEKAAEAEALLGRLEEEEREAAVSRSADRVPEVAVSGRAAAAVQYALAQVGDAYVWGAEGPDGFDCSGLTLMAWRQAGVSLPHSSSAQAAMGTPVSADDLQPGDLVFYYSPISHVGIYIGGGQIVDAANPGTGVRVTGVFSMPFSGAVRPG